MLDLHSHYPVTNTETQTILQDTIKLETMLTTDDRIVLTRSSDNKYHYEHRKGNVPTNGICLEEVDFPFEEDDLDELKTMT